MWGHVGVMEWSCDSHVSHGKVMWSLLFLSCSNGILIDHHITEVNGQNMIGLKDKEMAQVFADSPRTVTITIMPSFIYDHMMKKWVCVCVCVCVCGVWWWEFCSTWQRSVYVYKDKRYSTLISFSLSLLAWVRLWRSRWITPFPMSKLTPLIEQLLYVLVTKRQQLTQWFCPAL